MTADELEARVISHQATIVLVLSNWSERRRLDGVELLKARVLFEFSVS